MQSLSVHVRQILSLENEYNCDISKYCEVLSYSPYFKEINEKDYIKHHNDRSFEYTPEFNSFIKALYDAELVEDEQVMIEFIDKYNACCSYKTWMKEVNLFLNNSDLLKKANISLLKKIIFSMIRLERIIPGSWGIDVEAGNWQSVLRRLKEIYPLIYKPSKRLLD